MNAVREETSGPLIAEFEGTLPFSLDPFQREVIENLDRGRGGVLVSAHTSSGQTIVAEYAICRVLREGAKVLYTTPLKALSNQKCHDFVRAYGESLVGLVTGENTIHDDAPVVVMTTEILRNLIYEDPGRLDLVRYVVLDEVHYIDDFPRGSVWEEIVIQTPLTIKLIGLSATTGNYREIADWMPDNGGRERGDRSRRRRTLAGPQGPGRRGLVPPHGRRQAAAPRVGRAPRRPSPLPQRDGRGALPARADQSRLRNRDVVIGHQHAG